MSVKTEINIENKPKATMKNFQFVENLDKLIDVAEKEEEGNEPLEDNRRSFYDLVMIRSRYIDRYDWYDTIFEKMVNMAQWIRLVRCFCQHNMTV